MKYMKYSIMVLAVFALYAFSLGPAAAKGQKVIAEGSEVSIEYTLYLEDGTVADSNVGKKPLVYKQGAHMLITGLEKRLVGLQAGDTKKVEVAPEEAYGVVDKDAFQEVPRDRVPEEAQKVGAMLQITTQEGNVLPLRVHEVKEKTVVVDFNHPLAGKKLTFDVKIIDVQ